MWNQLVSEFGTRGATVIFGMLVGAISTGVIACWKRRQQRLSMLQGDARDTVVIAQHLVESIDVPAADGNGIVRRVSRMRVRALGQSQLDEVVPNGHLASELLKRARHVTTRHTLISMVEEAGSYMLEALTNFVCDRVANAPFEHDLYVMAPCCEPAGTANHQPITILLVRTSDLPLFENWETCRDAEVEHGIDGTRVLTLMELAKQFRKEQSHIAKLRKTGQRTRFVETMYVLDLALDLRCAPIATKPIPWVRFEAVLKEMGLK